MTIPDYQSIMMPLLKYSSDGKEHRFSDAVDHLAQQFRLTEEELRELLPSGRYPKFRNRVGWAKTYLVKARLMESQTRGSFVITNRGKDVIKSGVETIDNSFLRQYPEFLEFEKGSSSERHKEKSSTKKRDRDEQTPDERLEDVYLELRASLAQDLLEQVEQCAPSFFEKLVIDLLVSMGYGGSIEDAGRVVGKTGDEGVDGIIKEDRLGLDVIYVQAKKWKEKSPISRPEIQKFVGALQGKNAKKGVFITTGKFSEPAKEYVKNLNSKVVLIDGKQLGEFMIDFNVGVSLGQVYEIKKIDTDYFTQE